MNTLIADLNVPNDADTMKGGEDSSHIVQLLSKQIVKRATRLSSRLNQIIASNVRFAQGTHHFIFKYDNTSNAHNLFLGIFLSLGELLVIKTVTGSFRHSHYDNPVSLGMFYNVTFMVYTLVIQLQVFFSD